MSNKVKHVEGYWLGLDEEYFKIIKKLSKLERGIEDFIVVNETEETISKLQVPKKLYAIAEEMEMPIEILISKILADFVLRFNESEKEN